LWISIIFGVALALAVGYLKADILITAPFWSWVFTQASIFQFYNPEFFRGFGVVVINGVLWTISVALQLYTLMPLLAFLIRKTKAFLAILIALSIVAHILSQQFFPQENIFNKLLQVSALPWLYMFILGALFYYSPKIKERIMNVPVFLAFIGFLISMFFIGSVEVNSSNAINPLAVIFLMILVFHFAHSQLILNMINFKFIREHDFSYGIYFFHMPIINALLFYGMSFELSFLFLVISVIFMSILSWFFIERPCLSKKEALSNWFAER
jgi:peptidoglycan/LPS O-acetylase OafA/YrhL